MQSDFRKRVRLITYPDAYHVFDSVSAGELKKIDFTTSAWCRQEETDAGEEILQDTRKTLAKEDACWRRGVSLGHNEAATKKAHEDVLSFLKEKVLK